MARIKEEIHQCISGHTGYRIGFSKEQGKAIKEYIANAYQSLFKFKILLVFLNNPAFLIS